MKKNFIAVLLIAALAVTAFIYFSGDSSRERQSVSGGRIAAAESRAILHPDAFWKMLGQSTPDTLNAPGAAGAASIISLDTLAAPESLITLKKGDVIKLALPDNELGTAVVNLVMRDGNVLRVGGALIDPHRGSFSLSLGVDDRLMGRILLPGKNLACEITPGEIDGKSYMTLHALPDVICHPLPREELPEPAEREDRQEAAPLHHSRPSATAVLLMCFDGATVTDIDWNRGNTIVAAPSTLSTEQITEVWKRVSEDFAPFDINVTTDPAAYDAAPVGRRMRCIITPTSSWAGYSGGTAYPRSFRNAGRSFSSTIPCWVFNYGVSGIAETISHEFGHTLGLSHDGRTNPAEGYYYGHGEWGPIMGAPYGKRVTHWSKGEYPAANNPEDDMFVISSIANGFGYVTDGPGATPATAMPVSLGAGEISFADIITSATDADYYQLILKSPITLRAEATPAAISPNLDIMLQVLDHSGALLAADNPDSVMDARIDQPLASGTYYVKVDGAGRGDPMAGGYSDYGSAGAYTLTLRKAAPLPPPVITLHPAGRSVSVSEPEFSLHASADGPGTLRFQWQKDGVDLAPLARTPGVTTGTLSIRGPQPADSGAYTFVASNEGGRVTSAVARVDVMPLGPPVIAGFSPGGIMPGGNVIITGINFTDVQQVFFNGIPASSFTVDAFSQITATAPATLTRPGRVTITTPKGSADSPDTFFIATPPSGLRTLRDKQVVTEGHRTTILASATANPEPSFHWQVSTDRGVSWSDLRETDIYTGVTTNRLGIFDITAQMHNHLYRFVAGNGYGTAASNPTALKVIPRFFAAPVGLDFDKDGNLYVSDVTAHIVQKITPTLRVDRFAGTPMHSGTTDGAATAARFNQPRAIAFDYRTDTLLLADTGNAAIRRITLTGDVTTYAGMPGIFQHKDGNLYTATFVAPIGIALDSEGNARIADQDAHTIRLRTPDGDVSTIIGAPGQPGAVEGVGTSARLQHPTRVILDNRGNLFIADTGNHVIRTVAADGTVLLFAGKAGVSGTLDHYAPQANLNRPRGMDIDSAGNLYFADRGNSTIRMLTYDGEVITIAGEPEVAGLMDGIKDNALFDRPSDVTFDGKGNLYIADTGNAAIRKIELATGLVTTLELSGTALIITATTPPPMPIGGGGGDDGGGGGGGAPTLWYLAALAAMGLIAALRKRRGNCEK